MAEGERTPGKDYADYGGRSRCAAAACGVLLFCSRAAATWGATQSSPWGRVEAVVKPGRCVCRRHWVGG